MAASKKGLEAVGRFHAIVRSVQEFDNGVVLPVVKSLLNPTNREHCFIAGYYRCVANARTLLLFTDPSHFQAIGMLARAMFELAVDIRLIDVVPDAIAKAYAYSDCERLRVARDAVALQANGKITDDVSIQKSYIAKNGARIDAEQQKFWPKSKRVTHWSGMNLRDRTKKLGSPYEETYDLSYAQLSWDVHPGLAGVLNLDVDAFPAKCGLAFKFAVDWYADILRAVARELKIDKSVGKFDSNLQLAMLLPMTDTPEEAQRLRDHLLG